MKRLMGSLAAALLLAVAGVATAGAGGNLDGNTSGGAAAGSNEGSAQVQSATSAEVTTPEADLSRIEARLKAIRDRAKGLVAKERDAVEKQIASSAKNVDIEASAQGEAAVSSRLASDFNVTAEALIAERAAFEAGWGELMVAHTLLANTTAGLEAEHLFRLRGEGMGWAQIAHGLGIKPKGFASAVRAEALVAAGSAKPDGVPARVATGANASTSTRVEAAATAGQTSVGTSSTGGVGVTTRIGK